MSCSSGDTISYTPQGRAYNRFNPSLGQTMNAALLSIIYGQAIQPPTEPPTPLQVRSNTPTHRDCWKRQGCRMSI